MCSITLDNEITHGMCARTILHILHVYAWYHTIHIDANNYQTGEKQKLLNRQNALTNEHASLHNLDQEKLPGKRKTCREQFSSNHSLDWWSEIHDLSPKRLKHMSDFQNRKTWKATTQWGWMHMACVWLVLKSPCVIVWFIANTYYPCVSILLHLTLWGKTDSELLYNSSITWSLTESVTHTLGADSGSVSLL